MSRPTQDPARPHAPHNFRVEGFHHGNLDLWEGWEGGRDPLSALSPYSEMTLGEVLTQHKSYMSRDRGPSASLFLPSPP